MQLYNQLFIRYLKLDADLKEPATVIMKNEESDTIVKPNNDDMDLKNVHDLWRDAILQKMPKIHKQKTKELIDFLNKSKELQVHDSGEVSINGTILPQSNIVNLVHDIVRDRPKAPGPLGFKTFAMLLRDLNIPKDLVGNPSRWNMIKEGFQTPDSKTPKIKVKRKLQYNDQAGSGLAKKMHTKYTSW